ncbi:MAG: 23S rRNA (uracil(1939)-C(5))-methyltransferase RlmD [Clostridia bacterium]|nr:23S rRNA (uracil(1939)-C(5))-methyltransferase RlmD [Clostridia bacterium]
MYGVFANRTHEIIEFEECKIQTKISQEIAKTIIHFINENGIAVYNEKTRKGTFRHIVIKYGMKTNQVMCVLVLNEEEFKNEQKLIELLISKFKNIKTIVKNINMKNTNVILGNKNIVNYGNGYIQDQLGEYIFNISANSFYQINPVQTEKLYNLAIESANLSKEDTIFDLYCGIGTIGIFAAKYVKKVYGIEIVDTAIEDAKENAKINSIENAEFIAGDVEEIFKELIYNKKIIPDVVFVDPPRKGLDLNTIDNLLKIKPKKIIYISCNPASLVRDLSMLEKKYDIQKITPVDLFPFTSHVECVAVLQLKQDM